MATAKSRIWMTFRVTASVTLISFALILAWNQLAANSDLNMSLNLSQITIALILAFLGMVLKAAFFKKALGSEKTISLVRSLSIQLRSAFTSLVAPGLVSQSLKTVRYSRNFGAMDGVYVSFIDKAIELLFWSLVGLASVVLLSLDSAQYYSLSLIFLLAASVFFGLSLSGKFRNLVFKLVGNFLRRVRPGGTVKDISEPASAPERQFVTIRFFHGMATNIPSLILNLFLFLSLLPEANMLAAFLVARSASVIVGSIPLPLQPILQREGSLVGLMILLGFPTSDSLSVASAFLVVGIFVQLAGIVPEIATIVNERRHQNEK